MYHSTLNAALAANNDRLVDLWPLGVNIDYEHTAMVVVDGTYISVYRDARGLYEEAISYKSECDDFIKIVNCQ